MLDIIRDNWLLLLIGQYPSGPLGGLAMTLILAIAGLILSFSLGVVLAVASICPIKPVRWAAVATITCFRSLPLLLLIFWIYYVLPVIIGLSIPAFATMLATLVLYQGAYMAEVVRTGLQSVPTGQTEAASALGFGFTARVVHILLPQALRNMLPSIITQFVSLTKDTSLGYVIGVGELTYVANQLNSSLLTKPFEVFGLLALTYFILCFTLASIARLVEARMGSSPQRPANLRVETT